MVAVQVGHKQKAAERRPQLWYGPRNPYSFAAVAMLSAFLFCPIWAEITHVRSGLTKTIQSRPSVHDQGPWSNGMHHHSGIVFLKWLLADGSQGGDDAFSRCLIRRLPVLICLPFLPNLGRNYPRSQRPIEACRARSRRLQLGPPSVPELLAV
jgi:hypothetical protein